MLILIADADVPYRQQIHDSCLHQPQACVQVVDTFEQLQQFLRKQLPDLLILGWEDNLQREALAYLGADPVRADLPVLQLCTELHWPQEGVFDQLSRDSTPEIHARRLHAALRCGREVQRRRALETQLGEVTAQLQVAREQLDHQAYIDSLTGLYNRQMFEQRLHEEWKRSQRHAVPLSLVIADLDFFKPYNDNYGKQKSDECLRAIANSLATVRAGDLVARYGGEEFVILLPVTFAEGALALAEHFRERVAALKIEHKASLIAPYVTVSIGVGTLLPQDPNSAQQLVEMTFKALREAKREGRNRVQVASGSVKAQADGSSP